MADHTRYQAHCAICSKVFEADTIEEAIRKAIHHEQEYDQLVRKGLADSRTHEKLVK